MDQEEKLQILRSARLLEEYENTPRTFNDPYAEMSDIEKSKLIIYLQELLEEQSDRSESSGKSHQENAHGLTSLCQSWMI